MPNTVYTISSSDSEDGDEISHKPEVPPVATAHKEILTTGSDDEVSDDLLEVALEGTDTQPADTQQDHVGGKRKSNGSTKGKGKKKSKSSIDKEIKKQKLAEEKSAKKAAENMNKIYKPGECMKFMNVEGHPTLWERWYMSDVTREVTAAGAHVVQASNICDPALVVWSRNLPRTLEKDGGTVQLTPPRSMCSRALYVAAADELSAHVRTHTLASHLARAQQLCDASVTLLVYRPQDYFKSPRRKTSNSNRTPVSEVDFELAITDLLVSAGCDTVIASTPNELALTIVQFTKAIAEAPFKKAKRICDEQAEFYMRGDNKKCVAVDKDGAGMGRLWQQMIAILPQSSLEVSRALCAKYKTPLDLYEVLSADNIEEVADIGVSRAAVAGSKSRRIGPEFARKLHTLFTAHRGNTLID
uniref:ERCC4 domain-containing protein n=1 Tax=Heliothis virescens TaxID=7102 RepID=A0A2A4K6X0_HELVI